MSPERVTDPLFKESDFFDAEDLVQVKYEMLRRAWADGMTVSAIVAAFGFSRPSFYKAQSDFDAQGLPGLVAKKRGPRSAHKLTQEVLAFLGEILDEQDSLSTQVLADHVLERFGISVHPRSIERTLLRLKKKQ
jgi:transposase